MSNRFIALVLCAVALSGCDLLATRVTPSSAPPFGTFETIGTIAPGGTVTGPAGPLKSTDIFGGSPTPSPSPTLTSIASASPSATTPPTFTPPAPPTIALPTVALPTFSPVITPTPSPTASAPPPVISAFQPVAGPRGAQVVIQGRGLATTRIVLFGEVNTTPVGTPSDTQVVVLVPTGATTSRISVVTANGVVTSTQFFEVVEPTPVPTCPIRTQCFSPPPTP